MTKRKHCNNRGFTLIELIVVIAIMAILVGVLAPNFLRYLENAKLASDTQVLESVRKAMELAMIEKDFVQFNTEGEYNFYGSAPISSGSASGNSSPEWLYTPPGLALVEMLGYSNVEALTGAGTPEDDGLVSLIKSRDPHYCQIYVWYRDGKAKVTLFYIKNGFEEILTLPEGESPG